jgi:hypothetical protein
VLSTVLCLGAEEIAALRRDRVVYDDPVAGELT